MDTRLHVLNPTQLEEAFKDFTQNFQKWGPDGVISVNLAVLHELGLLHHEHVEQPPLLIV